MTDNKSHDEDDMLSGKKKRCVGVRGRLCSAMLRPQHHRESADSSPNIKFNSRHGGKPISSEARLCRRHLNLDNSRVLFLAIESCRSPNPQSGSRKAPRDPPCSLSDSAAWNSTVINRRSIWPCKRPGMIITALGSQRNSYIATALLLYAKTEGAACAQAGAARLSLKRLDEIAEDKRWYRGARLQTVDRARQCWSTRLTPHKFCDDGEAGAARSPYPDRIVQGNIATTNLGCLP